MRIAICDDQASELAHLRTILESYAASGAGPLEVHAFSSAADMLKSADSERFTHYFLDILMPDMDGIAAAEAIRRFDEEAKIIFLTTSNEFACQSYRVRAFDYLLKPAEESQVFPLLDRLTALTQNAKKCLCLQTGSSVFRLPFCQIAYVEVNQKKLYFHLKNGQMHALSGTLSECEEDLLAQPEFVKIHRSYIVNLDQVLSISPEGCIMAAGENLPISRLLYKQIRERYMAHLFVEQEV